MNDSIAVRSILYFWWRKAEKDNLIIKFGDHTEPLSEKNWHKNTEKYIQRTAAPRESKTFKQLIDYVILDATEYAKQVNKNYKYAKLDNYIARAANLEKYRIGQTDQFKLPKFTIDFEDFINSIKDIVYDGRNRIDVLPLTLEVTSQKIEKLKSLKQGSFKFSEPYKELNSMIVAVSCEANSIFINTDSLKYESIINNYKEFRNFLLYNNISPDIRFEYAKKKVLIQKEKVAINNDNNGYDLVVIDYSNAKEQYFYLK